MEQNMSDTQNMNKTLEDQIHKTRSKDAEYQDQLENTSAELGELKRALKEANRKAQVQKLMISRGHLFISPCNKGYIYEIVRPCESLHLRVHSQFVGRIVVVPLVRSSSSFGYLLVTVEI